MNYKLNILKNGFTLIEMLISLIIVSSITILTFVVFLQIENIDYLETNKIEISNYSNNILNNISSKVIELFFLEKEVRASLRILFSEGMGVILSGKEVEIFVKEPNSNIQSHICNRRINSSKGRF